jgi:redox-sensitive bicupin YhaK (pirin superfamily)
MITVHRATDRRHELRGRRERWHSFEPAGRGGPLAGGLGVLVSLDEELLPPGGQAPRSLRSTSEIVTYVREGSLAYSDATNRSGIIDAGEFQRRASSPGQTHREANASRVRWTHVFHVGLRAPATGLDPRLEQRRFGSALRRDRLCAIASPDGRESSLRVQQDARLFSAILHPGRHLAYEISPGRCVWLQVVRGELGLHDRVLRTGDGVAVEAERAASLTAREETEILLIDLAESQPGSA